MRQPDHAYDKCELDAATEPLRGCRECVLGRIDDVKREGQTVGYPFWLSECTFARAAVADYRREVTR